MDVLPFRLEREIRKQSRGCLGLSVAGLSVLPLYALRPELGGPPLKIALLVVFAMAACGACYSIRRLWKSGRHPIYQRLAAWGPVESVVAALEREMDDSGVKAGAWLVSPNWLVGQLQVYRLRDIAWIFGRIVDDDIEATIIYLRDGSRERATLPFTAEAAVAVAKVAPWILLGEDESIKKQWSSHRDELLDSVREKYESCS